MEARKGLTKRTAAVNVANHVAHVKRSAEHIEVLLTLTIYYIEESSHENQSLPGEALRSDAIGTIHNQTFHYHEDTGDIFFTTLMPQNQSLKEGVGDGEGRW